jgi:hypothetical protein
MNSKVKTLITSKFEVVKNLLGRNNKVVPKNRHVYAATTGIYVGEMFVYVKKDVDNYYFLSIPKMLNRVIPIDKFNLGIDNKIIDFVQVLPRDVYKICCAQFKLNETAGGAKKNRD